MDSLFCLYKFININIIYIFIKIINMKLFTLILLSVFCSGLYAQNNTDTNFEIPKALKSVTPYGTIENVLSVSENGFYISDFIPRVGLKGDWSISEDNKYKMFTKIEFGLNLVRRDEYIKFSADPGIGAGHVSQTVFVRLGLIGISTPYGNISIGRQWGVNYTLSGSIDDMYLGGGYGIGVYSAGTDGGISGTGRADQVLKYEFISDKFYFGAQSQFRNISVNDQFFADSYGFASYYKIGFLKLGASYNKVLDGVEYPTPTQAKINDELIAVLIDYRKENIHFGIMPELFTNHEKNNLDSFYTGYGFEYSFRYNFGKDKKWRIVQNTFLLLPSNNNSKYMLNGYTFNLARRFSENTAVILGFTIDNSKNHDGSEIGNHILGIGFYYNFNYPVP